MLLKLIGYVKRMFKKEEVKSMDHIEPTSSAIPCSFRKDN